MAILKLTTLSHPEELSSEFLQNMINRMEMGFFRFGPVQKNGASGLKRLENSLNKYRSTGNKELLVDAANYAMIEFMRPSISGAYYKPEDGHGAESSILYFRNQAKGS